MKKTILRLGAALCAGAAAAFPAEIIPAAAENDSVSATITTTDGEKVAVELNEEMFWQDSTVYHHDIGMLTVALASCAYNNSSTSGQGKYIADAYEALGFSKDKTALFSYSAADGNNPYGIGEMNGDSQAFTIASRQLGDTTLLSITLRGTDATVDADVQTDLISALAVPYLGNLAGSGFAEFSKKVSRGLQAYVENEPEIGEAAQADKLKILVTGHSLGAAGANLLGTYLDSGEFKLGKVSQDDIFVYTYASPTTCAEVSAQADYSNIINIMNRSDIVTDLPGTFLIDVDIQNGEVRYAEGFAAGQKRYFDSHETKSIVDWSGHHPDRYINSLTDELTPADLDISLLDGNYSPRLAHTSARLVEAVTEDSDLGLQALSDLGCAPDSCESFSLSSGEYFFGLAPNGEDSLLVVTAQRSDSENGEIQDFSSISQELSDTFEIYLAGNKPKGKMSVFAAGEKLTGTALGLLCNELTGSGKAESAFGYIYGAEPAAESSENSNVFCITDISRIFGENSEPDLGIITGQPGNCVLVNAVEDFLTFAETHLSAEPPAVIGKDSIAVTVSGRVYAEITLDGKVVGKAVESGENKDVTPVPVIGREDVQLVLMPSDGSCQLTLTGREAGTLDFTAESLSGGEAREITGAAMEIRKTMRFAPENGQPVNEAKLLVLGDEGKPEFEVLPDGSEVKYREKSAIPVVATGVGAGMLAAVCGAVAAVKKRRKNA